MSKHPIQPLIIDDRGVLRFKENKIVQFLLNKGPHDMNTLAHHGFSQEDREQFAQLIGYSHSGFGELSYVSDQVYRAAELMFESKMSEKDARIKYLEDVLELVRQGVKIITPAVFPIHPDDLEGEICKS